MSLSLGILDALQRFLAHHGDISAPRAGPQVVDIGGESGIRTHGGIATTAVFKTAALNHSAISPRRSDYASGVGRARRAMNLDGRERFCPLAIIPTGVSV